MDDNQTTPVPGQEGGTPPPATQTPAVGTTPTTPPQEPPATPPQSLTREDVDAMLRERFDSLLPELTTQIQGLKTSLQSEFAPRTEVQKATQSAADKAFARAMKQLAPQMKGIDRLIQKGRMTAEDGEAAKMALLADSAGAFAADDDEERQTPQTPPSPFPTQAPTPTTPPQPPYDPRQATQEAANALMKDAGIAWDDVTPEMYKFRSSMRRDMNLGEFTKLVAKKVAEKERKSLVEQAKREYEQETKAVREADKNGATLPPPQGGAAGHTPKATLDDADDIGDVLAKHFGLSKT